MFVIWNKPEGENPKTSDWKDIFNFAHKYCEVGMSIFFFKSKSPKTHYRHELGVFKAVYRNIELSYGKKIIMFHDKLKILKGNYLHITIMLCFKFSQWFVLTPSTKTALVSPKMYLNR